MRVASLGYRSEAACSTHLLLPTSVTMVAATAHGWREAVPHGHAAHAGAFDDHDVGMIFACLAGSALLLRRAGGCPSRFRLAAWLPTLARAA